MIDIIEITIKEFKEKLFKEYKHLFPSEERREWHKIKKTYKMGVEKFYNITNNNETIGFFMLEKLNDKPYYLDYFAILEKYQQKGFGTLAIKTLLDKIVKNEGLCGEIEKEDENYSLTIKRANFYRNLGFQFINSEYSLYGVYYRPIIYTSKSINKNKIDKMFFDYYEVNVKKTQVKKYCIIIRWNLIK